MYNEQIIFFFIKKYHACDIRFPLNNVALFSPCCLHVPLMEDAESKKSKLHHHTT